VSDDLPDEVLDEVKIVSTGYAPKTRVDRFIYSPKHVFFKAKQINADIYHFHDPELLPVAMKLKRNGKTLIYDSHEDYPDFMFDKEWIPRYLRFLISFAIKLYETRVVKRMDAVIGVTPRLVERLKAINSNTHMITNYPSLEPYESYVRSKNERAICFTGSIDPLWNHENIIKALEQLPEDIKLVLCGKKSTESYFEKLKTLKGFEKVEYRGLVPHDEALQIIHNSSIGLAIPNYARDTHGNVGTLGNTKFFEYMMAGIPIVCTDFILWQEIVEKWNCGICVNPNDVTAIATAIEFLLENPDEAQKMGANGRRAVEEMYNWGEQEKVLLNMYRSL
jgi:glycosyltransferase involved in cell wall biosynthesis